MSWWFLQQAVGYVVEASRCTPEGLLSLTNRMRTQVLSSLPTFRAPRACTGCPMGGKPPGDVSGSVAPPTHDGAAVPHSEQAGEGGGTVPVPA